MSPQGLAPAKRSNPVGTPAAMIHLSPPPAPPTPAPPDAYSVRIEMLLSKFLFERKETIMKKFVTWLLVCLMVVSALPLAVFAEATEAVCPGKGNAHNATNCTSAFLSEVKATCEKPGYVLNACTTCATPFVVETTAKLDCVEETVDYVAGTCGTKEVAGKTTCTTCTLGDACTTCTNTAVAVPANETQAAVRTAHKDSWTLVSTYTDCTKGQTYYCSECKESFTIRDTVAYADHDWVLDRVTLEPTCTAKGSATLKCAVESCEATKTVEIAERGHDVDTTTPVTAEVPATCTENGTKAIYGCVRCNHRVVQVADGYAVVSEANKVIPAAHTYETDDTLINAVSNPYGWKTTRNYVAGDCTTNSTIEVFCTECGQYILETLKTAPNHAWGTASAATVVPCKGSYVTQTCGACSATRNVWNTTDGTEPAAKTHDLSDYNAAVTAGVTFTNVTTLNCVTDHKVSWKCSCGEETYTYVKATAPGHATATYTVASPNCTIPTYTFEYCTAAVCGMHALADTDTTVDDDGVLYFTGAWTDGTYTYTTAEEPNFTSTHPYLPLQVNGQNVAFIQITSIAMTADGPTCDETNHVWTKVYDTTTVGLPAVEGLAEATCTTEGKYVNICEKHTVMQKIEGSTEPFIGTDAVLPHDWANGTQSSTGSAATCTVAGEKATYKCKDCTALAIKDGESFVAKTDANVVIPATTHNMVNLVVKTDGLCNTAIATWDAGTSSWKVAYGYNYTIQVCTNAHCAETASTIAGLKGAFGSIVATATAPTIPASAAAPAVTYVDTAYATVTATPVTVNTVAVYGSIAAAAAQHGVSADVTAWTRMNENVPACESAMIYTITCAHCNISIMVEDGSQVGKHVNDADYDDEGEVAPSNKACGGSTETLPEYGKYACKFCQEVFAYTAATVPTTVTVTHATGLTITEAMTQGTACEKDLWNKVGSFCKDCSKWLGEGDAATKTDKTGHSLVFHARVEPKCEQAGTVEYFTCSVTGCTYASVAEGNRAITALEHNYVFVNAITNTADCKTSAATYSRCDICDGNQPNGHKVQVTVYAQAAHDFTSVVTEPASCTEGGKTYNKCKNCSTIDEASVTTTPAKGHTDATGTFSSDCDTGYTGNRKCTVCSPNANVAVTHKAENIIENISPATCTEDGNKVAFCNNCGEMTVEPTIIPAAGHHTWITQMDNMVADANGWFITVKPTVTETGFKVRQCSLCDFSETAIATSPVQYSLIVDNAIVPGATIVENSIVAVTVVLNKTAASVWGFELDVTLPTGGNFAYLGTKDSNPNFSIQVANNSTEISMYAFNTNIENVVVEEDIALITLLFRVVAPRTTSGASDLDYTPDHYTFSIDATSVVTIDANGEEIEDELGTNAYSVTLGQVLCMDDDDTKLTINDLREAFLLIQAGEYASEFDIDLDGALTLKDISTIQSLILVADTEFDAKVAELLKAVW